MSRKILTLIYAFIFVLSGCSIYRESENSESHGATLELAEALRETKKILADHTYWPDKTEACWLKLLRKVPQEMLSLAGVTVGMIYTSFAESCPDSYMRLRMGPKEALAEESSNPSDVVHVENGSDTQVPSLVRVSFDGSVCYMRLFSFDEGLYEELSAKLLKCSSPSLLGLVLDLRNNPGGYVDEVIKTTCLFSRSNLDIIVTFRNGRGREWHNTVKHDCPSKDQRFPLPVAVIINGLTASSAEMLAGILKDWELTSQRGRFTIIGLRSYGKGVTQSEYGVPGMKWGVRVTNATFLVGNRETFIHEVGIVPSHEVGTVVDEVDFGKRGVDQAFDDALKWLANKM